MNLNIPTLYSPGNEPFEAQIDVQNQTNYL